MIKQDTQYTECLVINMQKFYYYEKCGTKLGALYDVHPTRCTECILK